LDVHEYSLCQQDVAKVNHCRSVWIAVSQAY
jgi:hypothetical protein